MARAVSAADGVAGRVIAAGHSIRIEEAGLTGMIALRGDLASSQMAAAVEAATGAALPEPWRVAQGSKGRVVWMSPDELLILTGADRAEATLSAASEALAGQHHLALDMSDSRVVFRLTGAAVGEVLAKGAPVDLRDSAFPVGAVRRTHIAEIAVGFWRLGPEEWEIVCFRSLGHHLLGWLEAVSVDGAAVGHY